MSAKSRVNKLIGFFHINVSCCMENIRMVAYFVYKDNLGKTAPGCHGNKKMQLIKYGGKKSFAAAKS